MNLLEESKDKIIQSYELVAQEARELKIFDDVGQQRAIELLAKVDARLKRIDELKFLITKPLNEQKKAAENMAKMYSEPFENLYAALKVAIKQYLDNKAKAAEEEMRKAREAQAKKEAEERAALIEAQKKQAEAEAKAAEAIRLAKEAQASESEAIKRLAATNALTAAQEAEALQAKTQAAQVVVDTKEVIMVEAPQKTVRAESGAAVTRKMKWTWEVSNEVALRATHPELFILDEKAINKLIRDGERDIQGLRIFQESELSLRANN